MPSVYPPRPTASGDPSRFHTPAPNLPEADGGDGPTITMKFASPTGGARAAAASWNHVRELDQQARSEYQDLLARVNNAEERLMAAEDERDALRTQLRVSETRLRPVATALPRSPRAPASAYEALRLEDLATKLAALEAGVAPRYGFHDEVLAFRDRLNRLERELDVGATPGRRTTDLAALTALRDRLAAFESAFAPPVVATALSPRPSEVSALRARLAAIEQDAASDGLLAETARLRARLEALESGPVAAVATTSTATPRTPGGGRRAMRDLETGEVIVVDAPKAVSQEEVAMKERIATLEGLAVADGKLPASATAPTSASQGGVISEAESSLKERLAMLEGMRRAQDKQKAETEEKERKAKEAAEKEEAAMRERLAVLEGMELQRRIDTGEEPATMTSMLSPRVVAAAVASTSSESAADAALRERISILEGMAVERGALPKGIEATMPLKERLAMLEGVQIERGRIVPRPEVSREELELRERLAMLEGREAMREAAAASAAGSGSAPASRSPMSGARAEEAALLRTRLGLLRSMRAEKGVTPRKARLITDEEATLVERLGFLEGAELEREAQREKEAERAREAELEARQREAVAEEVRLRERIAYLEGQAAERETQVVHAGEVALRERLAALEGAAAEKGVDIPFEPLPPILAPAESHAAPGAVSDTEAVLRERIAMLEGAMTAATKSSRGPGSPLATALKSPARSGRTPGSARRRGVTAEELRLKERIAMLEGMELAQSASQAVHMSSNEVTEEEAVLKERVALLEGMQVARQRAEAEAEEKATKRAEDAQMAKVSKRLSELERVLNSPAPAPPMSAEMATITKRLERLQDAVEGKVPRSPPVRTKDPDKDSIVDDVVAHVRERTANAVEQTLRREREEALQAVEDALDDSDHARMRRRAAARQHQKDQDAIASGAAYMPATMSAVQAVQTPAYAFARPSPVPYTLVPTVATPAPVVLSSPPRARWPGVDEAYLTGLPEATKPHHRGVEAKYIDLLYGDGVALDRPVDADPHAMAASTIDALARTLSDERENALRRQERRRFLYESHGDPTAMASTGHMPRNPLSEAPRTVPESPVGGPRAPEWAALDGPSAGARRSVAPAAAVPHSPGGPTESPPPPHSTPATEGGGGDNVARPLASAFRAVDGGTST